jgi:Icc-related predicted phosphoesterase
VKVRIASDIHLDHYISCQILPDLGRGDVLILAGDILSVKYFKTNGYLHNVYYTFLENCSKNFNQVLYVLGNHEHFGFNFEGTFKTLKEHLPNNFHLLENDTIKIGDWAFVGFTLWTNFRNGNPIEMMDAEQYMNDYKVIRIGSNYRKLRAQDTLNFHLKSRDYLLNQLETLKENVFVISHHAPSYRSIADEYKTSSCNSAYCSDLDELIMKHPQIKYFIHGHTHTPFDYKIGECRVICNPVGYPGQNTGFNPHFYLNL